MRQITDQLLELQKLALDPQPQTPDHETEVLKLLARVPAPILGHFDRPIARGKKGVALVRNGTCGECHLQLPSGPRAALAYTNEAHLCDNCGRYLCLPANEPLGPTGAPPRTHAPAGTVGNRPPKKALAHVA